MGYMYFNLFTFLALVTEINILNVLCIISALACEINQLSTK